MNNAKIQSALRSRALSRQQQNQYTQGSKRTQVARGYSDCSSFVRWCHMMVLGADIGLNTEAQVKDKDLVTIHSGGSYPDLSMLKVGDLIYFGGNKHHYLGVGHVEMVEKVGKTLADCRLIGHGSGMGPTLKNLKNYCEARGNYLMTRRNAIETKTWALGDRVIEPGSYGEDVEALQRALIGIGYPVGSAGADGDCGDATEAAVRRFQKAMGLAADGEFGKLSLAALNDVLTGKTELPKGRDLTESDYPEPTAPDVPSPGDPESGDMPGTALLPAPGTGGAGDGAMGGSAQNPYPEPTAIKRKGSTGAAVKWIQWELVCAGYDLGKYGAQKDGIDGDFGASTWKAVKAFQQANALVVDGEVGMLTVAALKNQQGAPAPAPDGGRIYDVSSYDGNIDFDAVAKLSGTKRCEMMIIRAQASKLDNKLKRNIDGCKKKGILYGVYAYTYAATEAQGRADADKFYERVVSCGGEPKCWVIDAEEGKNTKVAIDAMRTRLRERIGKDGAIWFYAYDSRVRSWAAMMTRYDAIWSARWNHPDIAPGYADYDIWQFGYTNVPGIRKTTDTSRRHPNKTLEIILSQRAEVKA